MLIDDTGSVEGIYAFIYCTKWTGVTDALGKGQATKSDEFSEKYQIQKFLLQILGTLNRFFSMKLVQKSSYFVHFKFILVHFSSLEVTHFRLL